MFVAPTSEIWEFVERIVSDEGLLLYDLEMPHNSSLRVFVASFKEVSSEVLGTGASIEDCSKVCKRLQIALAVEGGVLGVSSDPTIEVSSPGVERMLRLPEHFQGAVGLRIKVVDASRSLVGRLTECSQESIVILEDKIVFQGKKGKGKISKKMTNAEPMPITVDLANVKRSHVMFEQSVDERP